MRLKEQGRSGYYLERKTVRRRGGSKRDTDANYRDWWLIKHSSDGPNGRMYLHRGNIYVPKELVGKRIRFKIEVLED